jgi:hypothetical protein
MPTLIKGSSAIRVIVIDVFSWPLFDQLIVSALDLSALGHTLSTYWALKKLFPLIVHRMMSDGKFFPVIFIQMDLGDEISWWPIFATKQFLLGAIQLQFETIGFAQG